MLPRRGRRSGAGLRAPFVGVVSLALPGLVLMGLAGCCYWAEKDRAFVKPAVHKHEEDPEVRAGYPHEVSCLAHPSDTGKYIPYRVGGGAAFHGDQPGPEEGTWGWDYPGYFFPARICLGWWHGRRYQGGSGAYKTDGPRLPEHERGEGHAEGHGEGHAEGHGEGQGGGQGHQ